MQFPYLLRTKPTWRKKEKKPENFSLIARNPPIGFLLPNMTFSSEHWTLACGILGNIISFGVFLSPLPTFYTIYKKKSTEGFQCLPYVVSLFSAMLWIYYAFLKSSAILLITINAFGVLVETIYICFFLFYASKKARIETGKLLVLFIAVGYGLVLLLTYFLAKGLTRTHIVGWICLVFSLCVFVAPLGIVKKVIQTKSVEYMPFALSAFLTLSAVVWFFYGLMIKDYNVAIPNVLGFTFGVVQMILYQIYNKSEKEKIAKEQQKQLCAEVLADQIIIVDEHKISDKAHEQVIDMTKLGALEKIPVVLRRGGDGGGEDDSEMINNLEKDIIHHHQTKMIAAV